MRINAMTRLLSINKPKDNTWIKKVEQKRQGQSKNSANDLKEGIFEESPSAIARELKMKSDSFQQAMSRLNFYINRGGKNIPRQDQYRLEQAKDALYRAYNREKPKDS